MFWLGVMGGGDVKLLMALGAWGGLAFTEEVAVLGVLLGGALAVALLASRGRLLAFIGKMRRFLLTVFVKELELELPKVDRKLTMPFGIPIAAAAIWSAVAHPLLSWGFRPWP
jgi:prepilin peptidase CpaA